MATKAQLARRYAEAKRRYHETGSTLRKHPTAVNRRLYEEAKVEYHRAGAELARATGHV